MKLFEWMKHNTLIWAMLLLSVAGFADAAYLAIKKLVGSPIVCSALGGGCQTVDASSFSSLFDVPLAMVGAIFYAVLIMLLTYYLQRRHMKVLYGALYLALGGGLFSAYLIWLQAFTIRAWCFYCIISDTLAIVIALLALAVLKKSK